MDFQNDKIFILSLDEYFLNREFISSLFSNCSHIISSSDTITYEYMGREIRLRGLGQDHIFKTVRCVSVIASSAFHLRALQRQIRRTSRIFILAAIDDNPEKIRLSVQKVAQIAAGYGQYRPSPGPQISINIVFITDDDYSNSNFLPIKNEMQKICDTYSVPSDFFVIRNSTQAQGLCLSDFDKTIVFGNAPWQEVPSIKIPNSSMAVNEATEIVYTLRSRDVRSCSLSNFQNHIINESIKRCSLKAHNSGLNNLHSFLFIDALDKRGVIRFFPKSKFVLLASDMYENIVRYIFQVMKKFQKSKIGRSTTGQYCICSRNDIVGEVKHVTAAYHPGSSTEPTDFGRFLLSLTCEEREGIIGAVVDEMLDVSLLDEIPGANERLIVYYLKENARISKDKNAILRNALEKKEEIPNSFRNQSLQPAVYNHNNTSNDVYIYDFPRNLPATASFMRWPDYYGPETRAMLVTGIATRFDFVQADIGCGLFVSRLSLFGRNPVSMLLKYQRVNNHEIDLIIFYSLNGERDLRQFEGYDRQKYINTTQHRKTSSSNFINDLLKAYVVINDFSFFSKTLSQVLRNMSISVREFEIASLDDLLTPPPRGLTIIRRKLRNKAIRSIALHNLAFQKLMSEDTATHWHAAEIAMESIKLDSSL